VPACTSIAEAKIAGARGAAEQILEDAKRDAEALKKEALLMFTVKIFFFLK
jgi:F0F1-type ATP synthase membrane subunit b/b'